MDSGNVYKHPFKRARTTGTYLAAATIGTDADRELIRNAVDREHAQVRSTASSPVYYNAFDPRFSCGSRPACTGTTSTRTRFCTDRWTMTAADAIYRDARRLGTTLQVRVGDVAG